MTLFLETMASLMYAQLRRRNLLGRNAIGTVEAARLVFKRGCWYLSACCQTWQNWRS